MRERFSNTILLISSIICMILLYGAITHPSVRSSHTLRSVDLNGLISSYSYSLDFELVILEARVEISNAGPLDVTLHNVSFTILFNKNNSLTIPIEQTIQLPEGSSYLYIIAPPDLIIKDEAHTILEEIKNHYVNYQITLRAYAICGIFQGSFEKNSKDHLVFLHPPPYELPTLFQHGIFDEGDTNDTFIVNPSLQMSPQSFRVGRLDDRWTGREHYWALNMRSEEKIRFSFNATEPIHFQLVLSSNPELKYWVVKKVLLDIYFTSFLSRNFTAPEEGLYIFKFQISRPESVSTVTLDCTRFWP